MTTENTYDATGHGNSGCCGGGKGATPSLPELERQLHALWARIQEERARQAEASAPVKKKGCCCG